jgi:hypothetical protein
MVQQIRVINKAGSNGMKCQRNTYREAKEGDFGRL